MCYEIAYGRPLGVRVGVSGSKTGSVCAPVVGLSQGLEYIWMFAWKRCRCARVFGSARCLRVRVRLWWECAGAVSGTCLRVRVGCGWQCTCDWFQIRQLVFVCCLSWSRSGVIASACSLGLRLGELPCAGSLCACGQRLGNSASC